MAPDAPTEAPGECPLCPRLVAYRHDLRGEFPDWHNSPVDSFGTRDARLLVVGLAPGVRGANRTGRPFTGDFAGDLLYGTLGKFGFTNNSFDARPDDGLALHGCMVTNAVRCVPPQNKPVGAEINACRSFLTNRIAALADLAVIVTLGKIAHDSTVRALGQKIKDHPFGHGKRSSVDGITLIASYHCSRYNTNTGVLTPEMFESVFAEARQVLDQSA